MKNACKPYVLMPAVAFCLVSSLSNAEILVGVGGPLTGPNAAFGAQLQKGAEQAAADINTAGGINGEKIKIVLGDDVSDPKQGISVANKFASDGVKYVVGHFNSGVSIPASQEVYAENGMLEITPAATNPVFTERGLWNTFRTCGRDDQQGGVAGKYLAEAFKDKKVAIIDDKTPYGQGLAVETKKAYNALGIKEVIREGVNVGDKDFSALISKMKEAGVSIIYWGGLHTEAGLIIRQAKDAGLKATLVSGDGIVSNELASIAGDAVEGTLNTFGPDPTLRPENKELVAKFKAAGFNPEAYTLYSYAAVQVIAEGIKATGAADDAEAVAKTLHEKGPFKTVLGDLAFDAKGDPKQPAYVMYEWKKGPDGQYSYSEMPNICTICPTCCK